MTFSHRTQLVFLHYLGKHVCQVSVVFYRAVYAVIVCTSVRLSVSVTSRCCVETTGRIELVFGTEALKIKYFYLAILSHLINKL